MPNSVSPACTTMVGQSVRITHVGALVGSGVSVANGVGNGVGWLVAVGRPVAVGSPANEVGRLVGVAPASPPVLSEQASAAAISAAISSRMRLWLMVSSVDGAASSHMSDFSRVNATFARLLPGACPPGGTWKALVAKRQVARHNGDR